MKKTILIALAGVLGLLSCSREQISQERREILLQAGVEGLDIATKTPYTITTLSNENYLDADVWVSTTDGSYANSSDSGEGDNTIAFHNTAHFVSNTLQGMVHAIYYPSSPYTTPVYLCGLFPQTAWSLSGGGTTAVSATIDGKTDLMLAPQVSTTLQNTNNNIYPTLAFSHLLTWLRISVKAEDANMVGAWGALQSISIQNANNSVNATLSTGAVTFSGSATVPGYCTGNNTAFSGQSYTLTTSAVEKAYILCAPVTATNSGNEYNLIVSTANRANLVVPINLKADGGSEDFEGNTAGHQFSVTLVFKSGTVATSVTAVDGWGNGGIAYEQLRD